MCTYGTSSFLCGVFRRCGALPVRPLVGILIIRKEEHAVVVLRRRDGYFRDVMKILCRVVELWWKQRIDLWLEEKKLMCESQVAAAPSRPRRCLGIRRRRSCSINSSLTTRSPFNTVLVCFIICMPRGCSSLWLCMCVCVCVFNNRPRERPHIVY